MAKINTEIIAALRTTASHLESSHDYQWGHMGSCNCGFLGQQITRLSKAEIHRRAMQRYGDWNEQLNDYCPTSGLPFDDLIREMIDFGFDIDDLKYLERLSDPKILSALPYERRFLMQNKKEDVILYLRTWAEVLEKEWITKVTLPHLFLEPNGVQLSI